MTITTTSPRGRAFLRGHVGNPLTCYLDPVGIPTIGQGFTMRSSAVRSALAKRGIAKLVPGKTRITSQQSDDILLEVLAAEILKRIEFHQFKWNGRSGAEGVHAHGVFAQDIYEVYPAAVTPGGWYERETGLPCEEHDEGAEYQPWSVDYSKLMTVVARCVQGVMARQDEMEKRLAALEA